MIQTIYTIGGYGFTEDEFFAALQQNKIDCFCDIRQRRGMRGRTYSFLNSSRLQDRLRSLGIAYVHLKDLAPTLAVRERQRTADAEEDIQKRQRTHLGQAFIEAFSEDILNQQKPESFIRSLPALIERPCLFCVERAPTACHRSLVADWLDRGLGTKVVHIGGGDDCTDCFEDPNGVGEGVRRRA